MQICDFVGVGDERLAGIGAGHCDTRLVERKRGDGGYRQTSIWRVRSRSEWGVRDVLLCRVPER